MHFVVAHWKMLVLVYRNMKDKNLNKLVKKGLIRSYEYFGANQEREEVEDGDDLYWCQRLKIVFLDGTELIMDGNGNAEIDVISVSPVWQYPPRCEVCGKFLKHKAKLDGNENAEIDAISVKP